LDSATAPKTTKEYTRYAAFPLKFFGFFPLYGQREDAPAKRLHDKDKKRKAFYELYTGTSRGKADNYTVCLDSGVLGTDKCVDIIKDLF